MKKYKNRVVISIFIASLLTIALLSYNLIMDKSLHILILIAVIVINILAVLVGAYSYQKLRKKITLLENDEILYSKLIEHLPLEVDEMKIKEKLKEGLPHYRRWGTIGSSYRCKWRELIRSG